MDSTQIETLIMEDGSVYTGEVKNGMPNGKGNYGDLNMNSLEEHKKSMEKICAGLNKYEKRKAALMCLERQFKAYQQLAKDKQWNRWEEYREILDTCWDAILDNKELNEDIWEKHERIKPENILNYLEDKVIQDKNVTSECIKREVENQANDVVQQKSLKNLVHVQHWCEQTDNLIGYIN